VLIDAFFTIFKAELSPSTMDGSPCKPHHLAILCSVQES
jgi:hypothetical protein